MIKATVQRHITGEETICFEGEYPEPALALESVTAQLALCREHMTKYNTEVHLVSQAKEQELETSLTTKGEELSTIKKQIIEAQAQLDKLGKRLRSA